MSVLGFCIHNDIIIFYGELGLRIYQNEFLVLYYAKN